MNKCKKFPDNKKENLFFRTIYIQHVKIVPRPFFKIQYGLKNIHRI